MSKLQLLIQNLLAEWITIFSRLSLDVTHDAPQVRFQLASHTSRSLHLLYMCVTALFEKRSLADKTVALPQRNPHPLNVTYQHDTHLVV